jgi:hypothetical protein
MTNLPEQIRNAMQQGYWKDPGSSRLTQILNLESSDPLILLSREKMESTKRQIAAGGYVEDPQFCMVDNAAELRGPEDHRVPFSHLIFIVTSSRAGDDVFCALDVSERSLPLLWFDWTRPVPERWRRVMSLTEFLTHLRGEADR